jgi:hypothetical protein
MSGAPRDWACKDFCALGGIPAIIRGKGDSPIFVDQRFASVPAKIGTVPEIQKTAGSDQKVDWVLLPHEPGQNLAIRSLLVPSALAGKAERQNDKVTPRNKHLERRVGTDSRGGEKSASRQRKGTQIMKE